MSDGSFLPRRAGLHGVLLAAAWLLLIALLVVVGLAARDYFEVHEARTPALAGLPLAEAERRVEEEGLRLDTYPTSVEGTAANSVTEQSPPPGAVVRSGRAIAVGVNVPAEADRMPTLTGVAEADARRTLRDLALPAPEVEYAFDERPAGRVIQQVPAAGANVAAADAVRLVVSRGEGPTRIELPDLRGLDVDEARTQLTVLGVRRVETVPVGVSMLDARAVTVQRPAPGSVVNAGQPVTLGYALEGSRVTEVPDVVGMEPWRARVTLRAAGLAVGPVEVVQREDAPEGVVETRPAGLTAVGAPVVLVVNAEPGTVVDVDPEPAPFAFEDERRGGERVGGSDDASADRAAGDLGPGGRSVPFRFDPNELGVRSLVDNDYDLRLVVVDDRGERTAIDESVSAGDAVRSSVTVYGDEPLLQTYVNGVFFQAWRP